jgi:hypothetical protein
MFVEIVATRPPSEEVTRARRFGDDSGGVAAAAGAWFTVKSTPDTRFTT